MTCDILKTMVKSWVKLIAVLLAGAVSVGLPVSKAISWGASKPYIWWVVGFQLCVFGISVFLGALTNSRYNPRSFWWFLACFGSYFGIAFGAMRLNKLVTSANDWPYGGDLILPVLFGFLACGTLWRPDFAKPRVGLPVSSPQPKL